MPARCLRDGLEFDLRALDALVELVHGSRSLRAAILAHLQQFALVQSLDADEFVGSFARQDQLVKLGLMCFAVPVLRVLQNEYHEDRHNRGARVDNELLGCGIINDGPGNGPRQYQQKSDNESQRLPRPIRYGGGKFREHAFFATPHSPQIIRSRSVAEPGLKERRLNVVLLKPGGFWGRCRGHRVPVVADDQGDADGQSKCYGRKTIEHGSYSSEA
jgi:hypothetical protein